MCRPRGLAPAGKRSRSAPRGVRRRSGRRARRAPWSKSAVRVILTNPRYTGHQVWNRQRKEESLIDVEDAALGHVTTLKWNPKDAWIFSEKQAHPALVSRTAFEDVQQRTTARSQTSPRETARTTHSYACKGVLFHKTCERRIQGNWNNGRAHYCCRFPSEYAVANKIDHPLTVYLREDAIADPLDAWLSQTFAPARIEQALTAMEESQPDTDPRLEAAKGPQGMRPQARPAPRRPGGRGRPGAHRHLEPRGAGPADGSRGHARRSRSPTRARQAHEP
ncbi:recombinase family protein [Streptomyces sp. NPDC059373]